MKFGQINKDHITTINLEAEKDTINIKMRFFNKGGDWKQNWYFEGFILEAIKDK